MATVSSFEQEDYPMSEGHANLVLENERGGFFFGERKERREHFGGHTMIHKWAGERTSIMYESMIHTHVVWAITKEYAGSRLSTCSCGLLQYGISFQHYCTDQPLSTTSENHCRKACAKTPGNSLTSPTTR